MDRTLHTPLCRFGALSAVSLNGVLNAAARIGRLLRIRSRRPRSGPLHDHAPTGGPHGQNAPQNKKPAASSAPAGMESERPLSRASTTRRSSATWTQGDADCAAFEQDFKGRLGGAGGRAAGARRGGEALRGDRGPARPADSYASLLYAGNTSDPARAKFYGDVQERITAASIHLLFFTLELNRIDDAVLDAAMADPALGHYRPWIEDVRKEKPYQLEDRVEQLFHEKSVTGYSAWNRLFDETIAGAALQGRRQAARDRADAQFDAGRRRQKAQGRGARRWPRRSRKTCGRSR